MKLFFEDPTPALVALMGHRCSWPIGHIVYTK